VCLKWCGGVSSDSSRIMQRQGDPRRLLVVVGSQFGVWCVGQFTGRYGGPVGTEI